MQNHYLRITQALLLSTFLLCQPALAAKTYKGAAASYYDDSLAGWNGELPECSDEHPEACWAKSPHFFEVKTWYPVVSLGAGGIYTNTVGKSQNFTIIDPDTDQFFDYNAKKPSQTGALFEIFLGSEWVLNPCWNLQAGVDFDQVYTQYSSSGTFTQGADLMSADSYTYNYSVITRQVMAESKLLYTVNHAFHPYGLLALGVAFNSAYAYQTSVPPFSTFTREFSDNTDNALTFAAGVGLDIDINKDLRLGAGYRYTDLGKIALGPATINNVTVSGTLTQYHVYSNVFLAQITLLF